MDYETKYEKALERAKVVYHDHRKDRYWRDWLTELFPELKETESEDEKIRKEIIDFVKSRDGFKGDWIAWLEKQDENKHTDKVEPKFHEGDWITNGDYTWKIVVVKPLDYILQSQDGNIVDDTISYVDKHFHLWTIQDVKDSDVLCYEIKNDFKIFIYKQGHIHYHCCYSNGHLTPVDSFFTLQKHLLCYIQPATKEQRDLLFQKMKEAGYEWDSEKKELKMIGPKKLDADNVWLKNYISNVICFVNQFKKDLGL